MPDLFLTATWSTLGWIVASVAAAYLAMIVYTRIAGLRSFAKMSGFDFAATIAIGSIAATTAVSSNVSIASGVVALGTLYALQALVAWLRVRWTRLQRVVDNAPLVLMEGPEVLHENLAAGQLTVDDLRGKLREFGVMRREQVHLVVLETTGDLSVLTGGPEDLVEPWLLEDVRGRRALGPDVVGDR